MKMLFITNIILLSLTVNCIALPTNKPDLQILQPDGVDIDHVASEFDLVLTEQQKDDINVAMQPDSRSTPYRNKRKMVNYAKYRWPRGIVPYEIDNGLHKVLRLWLKSAINEWHAKTCIRFVKNYPHIAKRLGHKDYVLFHPSRHGCWTYLGRLRRGKQYSNISAYCGVGHIIHELGHVIGFLHEQSRPDRDENVHIIYNNIKHDDIPQFVKYSRRFINTYGIPYDIGSIMHYSSTAFSVNGRKTIQTDDKRIQMWMGQRDHLSFLDAKLANYAYRCDGHCTQTTFCKNGGYIGPTCKCVCPEGLTGPTCEAVVISNAGCGGVFRELSGFILSSRYPKNYIDDEDCFWFIQGPDHSTIKLRFIAFKTEKCKECSCDFLEVRVYGVYKVGQRYCGEETGRILNHNSSSLLLHFHSDINFSDKGFLIEYLIIV